ncbi:alpha/beta fold hydrolase [Candidatus Acetothermia bacterium]|jgi:pimeloyl-ACP methyl ester carboxylesterase|nr:alpha/beta fold hydrolase [Candidatus Acetothermia bacterium]MCI2435818.1 alpha/beta fold hydrolase [Candidatus Acetothermia bacterium]
MRDIDYIETGQGETLTLLHGLFGGPENWHAAIEVLQHDFHILAPRFPLDGSTPLTSVRELTEFVKGFLDSKGVAKTALVGNSLGGHVALDLALQYPQRVTKLILAGSAGLYERHLADGNFPKPDRDFIRTQAHKIFYQKDHITDEMIEEIYKQLQDRRYVRFLLRIAKATRDYRMDDLLAQVQVPTLLVWGAQDEVTPPHVAHQFQRSLPRAQLVFFERCGHAPPIEHPHEFGRVVREFLTASPAPSYPHPAPLP